MIAPATPVSVWAQASVQFCFQARCRAAPLNSGSRRLNTTTAKPFYGVDPFVLGRRREQIQAVAGAPDAISAASYLDDVAQESWRYQNAGVELDFLADEDWRLASITIESPDISINGTCFVGLAALQLIEAAAAAGIADLVQTADFDGDGTSYESDDFGLMIWVANGVVVNLTLFPKYDEVGDKPVWPDKFANEGES